MIGRRARAALAALLLGPLLAACSGGGPATPSATPVRPEAHTARVTKLLVVVVENHSLDQMRHDLPFTFGLAEKYGYATGYTALTHPSEPNYLGIVGGDTFGITDDGPPSEHVVHGRSVFGQALASGHTARVYEEGMPSSCALTDGGDRYAVKHNPWAYFVDERDACSVGDVSLDQLSPDVEAGHLPDAGLLVPNLCHDAHDPDCDLSDADAWMQEQLGLVMSGPDWRSGHLAVVVTADEDDHNQDNTVLTTVFHPGLHGKVVSTPLTHYSLTRLYDDVLGVPHLRGAADAPDLAKAFGLDVGPR